MRASQRICSVAFAMTLALVPRAFAAPDHLICRSVKEVAPPAKYSADVVSAALFTGTGCVVKAPARILCEEATVSNVAPPPPNGAYHGRGNPGRFVCYALKCPKDVVTMSFPDLIDGHTFTLKGAKLLCAPEVVSEASACTTPGDDCNSCTAGCAAHQGGGAPNVCVDPGFCDILDVACTDDSGCPAGASCVTNPIGGVGTACCAACAP